MLDEEVLDEVYASNGSKPAPDYSRPKRSKRSKRKRAVTQLHSLIHGLDGGRSFPTGL
ncbi:unnamed protein product [Camellia sinensis]